MGQVVSAVTPAAAALPLAPVHLRAKRLGDGSIGFSWFRRSRADDDAWGMAEPGLEVVPEHYRLSIFDGSTVKRVIDAGATQASYSLAEQVADFGGAATGFVYTVAQVSPALGAGQAREQGYGG
jgi:hypothetical protein